MPFIFAKQLRSAQILTPYYADWLSSDRPPLQTGLYLLFDLRRGGAFTYQVCATSLQMLSLAGVWMLVRSLGGGGNWALAAGVSAFFTPLVLTHGIFAWPKLIAAAYLCIPAAIHFAVHDEKRSARLGALGGAGAVFALLAHGSSAFAIIGLGLAAILVRRFFTWRYVIAGLVAGALLYAPWSAYQDLYDPPGNRAEKIHLAGEAEVTDKRSLMQALADSYSHLSLEEWVDGRLTNARVVVIDALARISAFFQGKLGVQDLRNWTLPLLPLGLGLFILSFYALPAFLLFDRTRSLAIATLSGIAVWILLIFTPGQTVRHHGSFFFQLTLIAMTVTLASAHRIPPRIASAFLLANTVFVGTLYVLP